MTISANVLTRIHTKVLLKALRLTRARNGHFFDLIDSIIASRSPPLDSHVSEQEICDRKSIVDADSLGYPYEANIKSTITIDELKAELATRSHVPNKVEAYEIRCRRAKAGRLHGRKDR